MEEIKEIEEEESQRWITILLAIANVIIWTIIMLFISIATVEAAAVNPNSNEIYAEALNGDNPEYINIGQNQEYTLSILKRSNLFVSNFINLGTGVYKGTAYVKFYNLQDESCSQLRQATNRVTLSLNNVAVNGTINIPACTISENYATLKIEYSYTNMQTNGVFKLIYRLPNWLTGTKFLMNSTLDYEAKDYATNTDIENQTISIINNAIQNAQDIINNSINENILNRNAITGAVEDAAEQIIENAKNLNKTCKKEIISMLNISLDNRYLNSNGELGETNLFGVTDYIKLLEDSKIEVIRTLGSTSTYSCFYNYNKELISCFNNQNTVGSEIAIPQNTNYVRFSINKISNLPNYKITNCQDRTQAEIDAMEEWWSVAPWLHETPDESDFDTTHAMENDILDMADDIDLDDVSIDIDTNTANWVWTTLTSLMNTSALVGGMFISILSIGIIKLILNR